MRCLHALCTPSCHPLYLLHIKVLRCAPLPEIDRGRCGSALEGSNGATEGSSSRRRPRSCMHAGRVVLPTSELIPRSNASSHIDLTRTDLVQRGNRRAKRPARKKHGARGAHPISKQERCNHWGPIRRGAEQGWAGSRFPAEWDIARTWPQNITLTVLDQVPPRSKVRQFLAYCAKFK
jgi:hypothetical protein